MAEIHEEDSMMEMSSYSFSVPVAVLKDRNLNMADRMVYVVLLSYSGRNKTAWPSHKIIAEEAGTSVSTVRRSIESLEINGYIEKEVRFDPKKRGGQTSNLYSIHTPQEAAQNRKNTHVHIEQGGSLTQPEQGGCSQGTGGVFTQNTLELRSFESRSVEQDLKTQDLKQQDLKAVLENKAEPPACQSLDPKYAGLLGERTPEPKTAAKPLGELCSFLCQNIGQPVSPESAESLLSELALTYTYEQIKQKILVVAQRDGVKKPLAFLRYALKTNLQPVGAVPHTPYVGNMGSNGVPSDDLGQRYSSFYELYPELQGHDGALTENKPWEAPIEIQGGALGWL